MSQPTYQFLSNDLTFSLPKASIVDHTDPASFSRFLMGIANAFASTPLTLAFICEIDNIPPPYPSPTVDTARLLQHISAGIAQAASHNAILLESGDYSALAVWETTAFTGVPFTAHSERVDPIRKEWRDWVSELKTKYIGTKVDEEGRVKLKPHYHLGFLARNPHVPHVTGAISAVMWPLLEQVVQESVVVWLEATNEHAVEVYKHFGFRTVKVVRVGVGYTNEEGWPEEGGSGTRGWAMISDQHLQKYERIDEMQRHGIGEGQDGTWKRCEAARNHPRNSSGPAPIEPDPSG